MADSSRVGLWGRWTRFPLWWRIIGAMLLGVGVGFGLPASVPDRAAEITFYLSDGGKLILRLLMCVAVPLIFCAIIHALLNAKVNSKKAGRLFLLLLTNTSVAILIGLVVTNVLQPGTWTRLEPVAKTFAKFEPWEEFKNKIPTSVVGALANNAVVPSILIALALGLAIRQVRKQQIDEGRKGYKTLEDFFEVSFSVLMVMLHWVVELVPLAVFGVVAQVVATQGFKPFVSLGGFIVAVLVALTLQASYYLLRVRFQSWVKPRDFLRGGKDALLMAFSTASSSASSPLNYLCLKEKIGLREESASLGALVGSNFNNDGTALYEAMAPMYIAQAIHQPIDLVRQPIVAVMAVVASVGAPGIPEAGLVTMVLVFQSVGLPIEYVALLLPVDWFLDRCRTTVNLMGDMTVAALLDGKESNTQAK